MILIPVKSHILFKTWSGIHHEDSTQEHPISSKISKIDLIKLVPFSGSYFVSVTPPYFPRKTLSKPNELIYKPNEYFLRETLGHNTQINGSHSLLELIYKPNECIVADCQLFKEKQN